MKKIFNELLNGLIVSLLIFGPYLVVVYLFVQWNVAQTNNLKESDFTSVSFSIAHIDHLESISRPNKEKITQQYVQVISKHPHAKWRIEDPEIKLFVNDTIYVKYRSKELDIATGTKFSNKIQRFFSTYSDQILVYKVNKGKHTLFEKPINEYDNGTTSRGQIFMSIFTFLWIVIIFRVNKYYKQKKNKI